MRRKHRKVKSSNKGHAAGKPIALGKKIVMATFIILLIIVLYYASSGTVPKFSPTTAVPKFNNVTLNITMKVVNDQALAVPFNYYWALGNYTKNIVAKPDGNYSYLVTIKSIGNWTTFKGLMDPRNTTPEPKNGSGTFIETYSLQVPGNLNLSRPTTGFIGTYNFNGSLQNILAGMPPSNIFNWPGAYFSTGFEYVNLINVNETFTYGNQTYTYHYTNTGGQINETHSGDILT